MCLIESLHCKAHILSIKEHKEKHKESFTQIPNAIQSGAINTFTGFLLVNGVFGVQPTPIT